MMTGKIIWTDKPPTGGSAAILYADGNMIWRFDRGPVYLVKATPKDFTIKGQLEPPKGDGPAWPHPVIHDGKLYLRHRDVLLCYDISE